MKLLPVIALALLHLPFTFASPAQTSGALFLVRPDGGEAVESKDPPSAQGFVTGTAVPKADQEARSELEVRTPADLLNCYRCTDASCYVAKQYPSGSQFTIECYTTGGSVNGNP